MIAANTVSRNGEHLSAKWARRDDGRLPPALRNDCKSCTTRVVAAAVAMAWFTGAITVVARMGDRHDTGVQRGIRALVAICDDLER